MTTGRTTVIVKDLSKGNQPESYRRITCLLLLWTLTTTIAEKLYNRLEGQGIIGAEKMAVGNLQEALKTIY